MTSLQRAAYAIVLVAAVVWWLPSIIVGLVLVAAFHINTRRLVRRARRLRKAGRFDEALAVLERSGVQVVEEQGGGQ